MKKNKYYLIRENNELERVIAYIETYKELLSYLNLKEGSFYTTKKYGNFKVNGQSVYIERYINDKIIWTTKNEKKS